MPPEPSNPSERYTPAEPLRYPPIDPRSALHAVWDTHGERRIAYGDLLVKTHQWPITEAAPESVNALLATARQCFALAMYHYDLFVVGSTWSLMAVESALRHHYQVRDNTSLARLIKRAATDGLFDTAWVDRLDAGRQLRNGLVHVQRASVFNPAIAASIILASHQAIEMLYPPHRETKSVPPQ